MTVQLQKATQCHYWRAVMTIFPLAPDQTIAQMWSNGVWGGSLMVEESSTWECKVCVECVDIVVVMRICQWSITGFTDWGREAGAIAVARWVSWIHWWLVWSVSMYHACLCCVHTSDIWESLDLKLSHCRAAVSIHFSEPLSFQRSTSVVFWCCKRPISSSLKQLLGILVAFDCWKTMWGIY